MRFPKGRTIKPPNLPYDVILKEGGSENEDSLLVQEIRSLGSTLREIRDILKSESCVKERR
jgi:hypothetical protein